MKNKQEVPEIEVQKKKIDWGELLRYFAVGAVTTAFNWGCTIFFTEVCDLKDGFGAVVNSVLSWIISILLFAFWAYKIFAFKSKSLKKDVLIPEFIGFALARLITLGVESAIMGIGTGLMGLTNTIHFGFTRFELDAAGNIIQNASPIGQFGFYLKEFYIVKFVATVVITILNYIFSKVIIFKPKKKGNAVEDDLPSSSAQGSEATDSEQGSNTSEPATEQAEG